jgi:HEAT repeat protein
LGVVLFTLNTLGFDVLHISVRNFMYNYRSASSPTGSAERSLASDQDAEQLFFYLLHVLQNGDFQSRWEVAKRFPGLCQSELYRGSAMNSQFMAELLGLLHEDDEDWELGWFVTRILGELHHPEAIASLLHLAYTSPHDEIVQTAVMALANHGGAAIAPLSELLQHPQTRLVAAQSLAQIPHPSIVDVMLHMASDPDPSMRAAAIATLSHTQDQRGLPVLIQALHDADASIRCTALGGLGFWADPSDGVSLAARVEPLLWDINLTVRQQAILTLGRLGSSEAIRYLISALHSADMPNTLRPHLVRTLAWSENVDAMEALCLELHRQLQLEETPDLAREIVAVLGRIETPWLKPAITEQLLAIAQTTPSIERQPVLKQAIAFSLGQLGQREALDFLQSLAADQHEGVKFHAIAALQAYFENPSVSPRNCSG